MFIFIGKTHLQRGAFKLGSLGIGSRRGPRGDIVARVEIIQLLSADARRREYERTFYESGILSEIAHS